MSEAGNGLLTGDANRVRSLGLPATRGLQKTLPAILESDA